VAKRVSSLSVITIVKNRNEHLVNQLCGFAAGDCLPTELVIVDMSDEPVTYPAMPFDVTRLPFPAMGMPLAAARNAGAAAAKTPTFLFLDVDCIPRRNLLKMIGPAVERNDAVICPEVRYLGPGITSYDDEQELLTSSRPHPVRTFPVTGTRNEPNPGLFWSLAFGMRGRTFHSLGGFDEGYEGYGGEDTDFGYRIKLAGIPLSFLGGTGAFHQYHSVFSPPLQHLADIVRNANRFYARWDIWPMGGWLTQFAKLGLVHFEHDNLKLIRLPTADEITAARQPPTAYF
jgi:GT2 family glycosyltransferase